MYALLPKVKKLSFKNYQPSRGRKLSLSPIRFHLFQWDRHKWKGKEPLTSPPARKMCTSAIEKVNLQNVRTTTISYLSGTTLLDRRMSHCPPKRKLCITHGPNCETSFVEEFFLATFWNSLKSVIRASFHNPKLMLNIQLIASPWPGR